MHLSNGGSIINGDWPHYTLISASNVSEPAPKYKPELWPHLSERPVGVGGERHWRKLSLLVPWLGTDP